MAERIQFKNREELDNKYLELVQRKRDKTLIEFYTDFKALTITLVK